MFVDHKELPETSKIFIYPSSRKFYPNEIEELEHKIKAFIDRWKVGDAHFKASFQLLYNRFIIIYADDVDSLLSVDDTDASVQFILELQAFYDVILLDRMNICFKQAEYVQYKDLKELKKLLKHKAITAKTIVFDNLVTTKSALIHFWELPIEESWYKRFL